MGITDALARWWYGTPPEATETRSIDDDFFDHVAGLGGTITQANATRLSVVLACQRIIADAIAGLPAQPYIRRGGAREPFWSDVGPWLDQPHGGRDPNYTWPVYISELVTSILSDGNAFVYALPFAGPEATELHILDPRRVEVARVGDGAIRYDAILPDNTRVELTAANVLHIPRPPIMPGTLRGVSPIDEARQALQVAYDAETYAATYYRKGGVPSGVIEYPGEMTQEKIDELKRRWSARHDGPDKVGVAILSGGMKFSGIPITFEQAQWIESRQFSVEDVARLFGVPLHMLQVATPGAMSYASVEQNSIGFVTNTLLPIVRLIESAHNRLLPGPATFLRLNLTGLLRGDAASRATFYSALFATGALSQNDIRRLEDQTPIPGGDAYYVPLNLAPTEAASVNAQASAANTLRTAGWSPAEASAIVGLPAPAAQPAPVAAPPPPETAPQRDVTMNLNVDAATFHVPEQAPPVVNVESQPPLDLSPLVEAQRAATAELVETMLAALAPKPAAKVETVERDARGLVTAVITSSATGKTRKSITRDATGFVVGTIETPTEAE